MRNQKITINNIKFVDIYILRVLHRSEKAKFHIVDKTLESRIEIRLKQLKEFRRD